MMAAEEKWYRVIWRDTVAESFVKAKSEEEARSLASEGKDVGYDCFDSGPEPDEAEPLEEFYRDEMQRAEEIERLEELVKARDRQIEAHKR